MRKRVPMAYSSGFNPHPRISYAGAAPTGAASEAEYVEIGLAQVVDPDTIKAALVESLPAGLDVEEVVESNGGSLADLLQASNWLIEIPLPIAQVADAVAAFLAADEVEVSRMTKKGLRTFDSRGAVVTMSAEAGAHEAASRLYVLLQHGTPSVRPDDLLSGLATFGLTTGAEFGGLPLLTRLSQGPFDVEAGVVSDPLAL